MTTGRLLLAIAALIAVMLTISCDVCRECVLTAVSPTGAWHVTFPDGTTFDLQNGDSVMVIGSGYTEARVKVLGETEPGALFTAYVYCGRETVAGDTTTERVIVLGWRQ